MKKKRPFFENNGLFFKNNGPGYEISPALPRIWGRKFVDAGFEAL
jgi:hypothetical protein